MKKCLILSFVLFFSIAGFAKNLNINLNDVREMERYAKYCKKVGQTPEAEMAGLEKYFKDKKKLTVEPITCGRSEFGLDAPMLTIKTKDKNHQGKTELTVRFRENSNKNSPVKYVVDKIVETHFEKCSENPECGYDVSDQKDIWPVSSTPAQDGATGTR